MLKKIGKGVFSKIKNQLTESQKDEIQFLWKLFSREQGDKQINQKQCSESFFGYLYSKMLVVKIYSKMWNISGKKKMLSRGMYISIKKEQSNICPTFRLSKDKQVWSEDAVSLLIYEFMSYR